MNKYMITGTIIGAAALLASTGIALAEDGQNGSGGHGFGGFFQQIQANIQAGIHGDVNDNENDGANVSANASTSAHVDINDDDNGNATSTERNKGQQGDKERGEHATSTASTTKEHEGFGKGGLPGFFRWLFGLPATTTIGDLRAQILATTSASTTIATSTSQGLGFWAHFFSFLHFGGRNN